MHNLIQLRQLIEETDSLRKRAQQLVAQLREKYPLASEEVKPLLEVAENLAISNLNPDFLLEFYSDGYDKLQLGQPLPQGHTYSLQLFDVDDDGYPYVIGVDVTVDDNGLVSELETMESEL